MTIDVPAAELPVPPEGDAVWEPAPARRRRSPLLVVGMVLVGVFVLVVVFTFFYTLVLYQQQNLAENLQKQGGFIPGIRPGPPTAEFLGRVVTRITIAGALFLGLVAVMPTILGDVTGVQTLRLGGTSLLIVVGVALDTMKQLEAQLMMRNYEGFLK